MGEGIKRGLKILILGVIISMFILSAVIAVYILNPMQNPSHNEEESIVGHWHITKLDITYSNGSSKSYDFDEYITFNASGTGYGFYYINYDPYIFYFNLTWKKVGENKIVEQRYFGSLNTTRDISYNIVGDSITMKYVDNNGNKIVEYGTRISSMPHAEQKMLKMALTYDSETSDIKDGKVYIKVSMTNPKAIDPQKVTLTVDSDSINYSQTLNYDKQWSYEDLDGDGKLSDGDIIEIHDTEITDNSVVVLFISDYVGSVALVIP